MTPRTFQQKNVADLTAGYTCAVPGGMPFDAASAAGQSKPEGYYSNPRLELIPFVPLSARRILEVGCGEGAFAAALRAAHHPNRLEIVGVETEESAAMVAAPKLDAIFVANIETLELDYKNYFDCVVFADVLEHLIDPWATLVKVKKYLRADGCVTASIPNVQHWRVVSNLFRGSWEYTNEGILDRTHLRFFTRAAVLRLFADTGFKVRALHSYVPTMKGRALNRATIGLLESLLAFQYYVVADCICSQHTKGVSQNDKQ